MVIKLKNNLDDKSETIEIAINSNYILFEWQDENDMFQGFELNLDELKKVIKFLEDDKKRAE